MNNVLQQVRLPQKQLFVLIGFFLLVIPKVNVIELGTYSGAGLRIDDFVLLLLLVLCFVVNLKNGWVLEKHEIVFFAFLTVGILSLLVNSYYSRGSLLYVLRLLEYWVFFYVGSLIGINKRLINFLLFLLLINGVVIIFQYFGFIGGYANGVYVSKLSRPSGLTNGAYEVPMLIALIFAFVIGMSNKLSLKIILVYLLSNLLIILTAARIPFIAVNLIFLYFLFKRNSFLVNAVISFLVLSLSTGLYFATSSPSLSSVEEQSFSKRFSDVFSYKTVDAVNAIVSMAPENSNGSSGQEISEMQKTLKTGTVNEQFGEAGLEADLSLMIRANKWLWAIKTYVNQGAVYWFFGIGPGTLGNALDGGLLRILIESGIIGILAFLYFVFIRPRSDKFDPMFFVGITFLVGNVFIDYYLSYKVMALYLMLYGASSKSLIRY